MVLTRSSFKSRSGPAHAPMTFSRGFIKKILGRRSGWRQCVALMLLTLGDELGACMISGRICCTCISVRPTLVEALQVEAQSAHVCIYVFVFPGFSAYLSCNWLINCCVAPTEITTVPPECPHSCWRRRQRPDGELRVKIRPFDLNDSARNVMANPKHMWRSSQQPLYHWFMSDELLMVNGKSQNLWLTATQSSLSCAFSL